MTLDIGYKSFIKEPYNLIDWGALIKGTNIRPDVKIGRYTSIAKNCTLILGRHTLNRVSTHNMLAPTFSNGHIIIGSDVWIGANVTIMDNITIGHGAVIGANSVITKDVPTYAIVVGNPGRIHRYRFPPEIIEQLLGIAWWNNTEDILLAIGINTENIQEFIDKFKKYQKIETVSPKQTSPKFQ